MRNCDYANRSSQLITSDSARQILQRCSTRFTPTREAKTESLVQKKPWDFFLGKCSGKEKKSPAIDLDQNRVLPRERILHELTARSEDGDLDGIIFLGKSYRSEYLRPQRSIENWSSANWTRTHPLGVTINASTPKKRAPHHGYIFCGCFLLQVSRPRRLSCNSLRQTQNNTVCWITPSET